MVARKIGKYLIVGTLGEGLVVINFETLEMRGHRLDPPDNEVSILAIEGNKAIANGTKEIELPVGARTVTRYVQPEYPEWAQKHGIEGKVEIKCWVLPSGEVSKVEILLTSGWPELDECACQALMKWEFNPIEGEEMQWGIVPFKFELS